jgi:hypothetical protein
LSSRRYLAWVSALACVLVGMLALVNRVVDPFWYFGDVQIRGFNADKTRFANFERHVKPALLVRRQPEVLILGSSYAEAGLRPDNPDLTEGGTLRGFNFAVAGAEWKAIYCNFEYALRHTRPRRIVLTIQPTTMPLYDCTKTLASMAAPDVIGFLLSWDAFRASLRTIGDQGRLPPTHTRDGLRLLGRGLPEADYRFADFLNYQRASLCAIGDPQRRFELTRSPRLPAPGETGAVDLGGLRQMVRQALSRRIELWLIVSPVHAYLTEVAFLCDRAAQRWAVLRQIAEMLDQEGLGDSAAVQVWDFQGYNAAIAERVTSGAMKWWGNPDHYNYELGDVMLARIRRGDAALPLPDGLVGERVRAESVLPSFDRTVRERADYVARQDWFYPDLRKLLPATALQGR